MISCSNRPVSNHSTFHRTLRRRSKRKRRRSGNSEGGSEIGAGARYFLQDLMPEKHCIKCLFCLQLLSGREQRRGGGRDKEMGDERCKRVREPGGRCSGRLATWLKLSSKTLRSGSQFNSSSQTPPAWSTIVSSSNQDPCSWVVRGFILLVPFHQWLCSTKGVRHDY